ncbi:MAG: hypothetical protein RL266_2452 [Bacteroidota bacterium]
MKRYLAIILLIPTICFSQTRIDVNEEVLPIDGNSRNSLTVTLDGADAEEIKKEWKKLLKDLKGKVSDKTVIFADDCRDKSLGDNTFDVYSIVEEVTKGKVRLIVAMDLGGAYLNSQEHPEQLRSAEKIVRDFAVTQAKAVVQTEIDLKQKSLKGLEKDLDGLTKDKEKHEKDIKDHEAQIIENQAAITTNIDNQKNKQQEIHKLESSQLEGHLEEVEKVIKGYEKEMDGMVKDKKKLEKDNESLAEKIKQAKADIEQNVKDQASKKTEIEAMTKTVQDLEVKLKSIH